MSPKTRSRPEPIGPRVPITGGQLTPSSWLCSIHISLDARHASAFESMSHGNAIGAGVQWRWTAVSRPGHRLSRAPGISCAAGRAERRLAHGRKQSGKTGVSRRLAQGQTERRFPALRCPRTAMNEDPVICWLIPRSETRQRVLPRFFALLIRHLYLPTDKVYTTEDLAAAALWLPPGNAAPPTSDTLRLASHAVLLLPRVGRALMRAPRMLPLRDSNHPKGPHYYLALLGTEPTRESHGIGSAMLCFPARVL